MRRLKKLVFATMIAAMLLGSTAATSYGAETGRGGVMGFIAGCCFGVRAAGDYNSGKEIHWREWVRLIPYANIVFAIWDGVDGANGMTRAAYAEKYGAMFY